MSYSHSIYIISIDFCFIFFLQDIQLFKTPKLSSMEITKLIRNELDQLAKSKENLNITDDTKYFKEKIKTRNLKTSVVIKTQKYFYSKYLKDLTKNEIFLLAKELLKSGYNDESKIAFDWLFRLKKEYTKKDFLVFETFLQKHVDNWSKCDDFCTHALGYIFMQFPNETPKKWAKSKNRWMRRAAAVIYIYSIRRDKLINEAFLISDILLQDQDDLVQKGYGWMLKEISNLYPEKVFYYVLKNKKLMPRTALRYAVEKLAPNKRKEAMKR